jgi:hypothetical protein
MYAVLVTFWGHMNPWERTFNIHWTGGCVDPRSGVDAVGREDLLHLPENQKIIYDHESKILTNTSVI